MNDKGFPPGRNVGTQLRTLRAKKARAERETAMAGEPRPAALTGSDQRRAQLALPSADGWFAAHGWQPFEFIGSNSD